MTWQLFNKNKPGEKDLNKIGWEKTDDKIIYRGKTFGGWPINFSGWPIGKRHGKYIPYHFRIHYKNGRYTIEADVDVPAKATDDEIINLIRLEVDSILEEKK